MGQIISTKKKNSVPHMSTKGGFTIQCKQSLCGGGIAKTPISDARIEIISILASYYGATLRRLHNTTQTEPLWGASPKTPTSDARIEIISILASYYGATLRRLHNTAQTEPL